MAHEAWEVESAKPVRHAVLKLWQYSAHRHSPRDAQAVRHGLGTKLAQPEKPPINDAEGSAHRSLMTGMEEIFAGGAGSGAEPAKPWKKGF